MRNSATFRTVVRTGRRATGGALTVYVAPGLSDAPSAQVGFVVARHVGRAVVRNRLRRQLRHVVRDRLAALSARGGGTTIVVRANPGAAGLTSRQLAADFDRAVDRATNHATAAASASR
jgi:ribonuclease P protein component